MKAVYCKTGEPAVLTEVHDNLIEYQRLVDGHIEVVSLWWNDLLIICNEEGRLRDDMMPNRTIAITGPDHRLSHMLTIYGDFLIVGDDLHEGFTDIPEPHCYTMLQYMNGEHVMWHDMEGEWSRELSAGEC